MKNTPVSLRWLALTAATTALLAACGGSGEGTPSNTPNPPPPASPATANAVGSSGSTVSLGWTATAQAGGYRIERQAAGGAWTAIADLPADSRDYVDDGLEPARTYQYRVLARSSGQVLATTQATTTEDAVASSAAGTVIGELARASVGANGGRIASADGAVAVNVPAGAFAAATEIVLRATTNTAPDGRDDGVELALAAPPAKPLQLTLAIGNTLAKQADGLRVAMQRGDGSWLALPSTTRSAQQLQVQLPLPAAAPQAQPQAAAATASAGPTYRFVKYGDVYLKPSQARVATGGHKELVPYAHTVQPEFECEASADWGVQCLPTPVLQAREVPLTNDKPGYLRRWYVEGLQGGNSSVGMTVTQMGAGAVYIAPNRAPTPNPVTVTFMSTNTKTNRMLALTAEIEVVEPRWTGTLHGYLGAADIAFGFSAQSVWTLAPGAEVDSFTANGTQSINVINITCTATASPSSAPLPPGALKIDRSQTPATYTLEVGSVWDTVITGTCPGQPGQAVIPMKVPGLVQVSGTVEGDGKTIKGKATINGVEWDWALTSEL